MNAINVSATDSLHGVYSEQGAAPTTMTVINAMDMIGQVVDAALITWSSLRAGATTMSPTLQHSKQHRTNSVTVWGCILKVRTEPLGVVQAVLTA